MKIRSRWLWVTAFVLVVVAAIYQRMTGPTYPARGSTTIGAQAVQYRLPRSSDSAGDAEIRVAVPEGRIGGFIRLRRTPSRDEWRETPMERRGDLLVGMLPHQPPAGKIEYQVFLDAGAGAAPLTPRPLVLRFKGHVPPFVLWPHVVLMFLAMLFSTRCGLEALVKGPGVARLTVWTVVTLCAGGLILGPTVQKYSFGAFWTGWPFGQDLTDNKTIVAALFWVLALWRTRKHPESHGWALAASIILMAVYMIPHSVQGSELDYTRLPDGAAKP